MACDSIMADSVSKTEIDKKKGVMSYMYHVRGSASPSARFQNDVTQ